MFSMIMINDTQAYIRMDCKRVCFSPRSRWQRPLDKIIVAHTLKWPSGLVCQATCIKNLKINKNLLHIKRREDKEEISVLDVGGKPQKIVPGENPRSQVGTENQNPLPIHVVPWLGFEPSP